MTSPFPTRPLSDLAAGASNGIDRNGEYRYASGRGYDGSAGVSTWSLADPDHPELVAQSEDYLDDESKILLGLAVANDHLYLFDNNHGVFVSGLADPMALEFAATGVGAGQYTKITSSGNTIFATGRNWFGNTVLDVFDTSTPAQIGRAHV